jgi:hypothetical protein
VASRKPVVFQPWRILLACLAYRAYPTYDYQIKEKNTMSYQPYYADYDYEASETRRLARIRRNKIIRITLIIMFLVGTHLGAYRLGRTALHTAIATTPTPITAAPTNATPTHTPASTKVPTQIPTQAPKSLIEIQWDIKQTDLSGGGSSKVSVMLRHNGCFDEIDLWACEGNIVALKAIYPPTLYINDYANKISYVIESEWVTLRWDNDMNLFFKRSFPIGPPPSNP